MNHIDVDLEAVRSQILTEEKEKRAQRLKLLRKMTGFSRKAFAEKHNISAGNFQNWEGPRYGGLTEKAAISVVRACYQEGVEATVEWLMYGTGLPPAIICSQYQGSAQVRHKGSAYCVTSNPAEEGKQLLQNSHSIEQAKVAQELELFKKHYGYDVLATIIDDDLMQPFYRAGDCVAGKRHTNIAPFLGSECIVETVAGKLLLRVVAAGSKENFYNLLCHSQDKKDASSANSDLRDVEILSVAPVMWVRRQAKDI